VRWEKGGQIAERKVSTVSEERKEERNMSEPVGVAEWDLSGEDSSAGQETLYVNASWMTMKKRKIKGRNMPIVITIEF